jgi:hypothetical protein
VGEGNQEAGYVWKIQCQGVRSAKSAGGLLGCITNSQINFLFVTVYAKVLLLQNGVYNLETKGIFSGKKESYMPFCNTFLVYTITGTTSIILNQEYMILAWYKKIQLNPADRK